MTLIVGLKAEDGIVLSSDSRGTIGDPRALTAINDTYEKVFKLSEYCGVATSGASELCSTLITQFTEHLKIKNKTDVDEIVNEFYDWGRKKYREWFGARPFVSTSSIIDQRPAITCIIVGYNKSKDQTDKIYLLTTQYDFVPQLCTSGHMLAGVPQYAIYLIHRLYNPKMKLENIKNLAAYLITETATQDPKVGGPVKMATITLDIGYSALDQTEIDKINQENEEQNKKLRNFFYQED